MQGILQGFRVVGSGSKLGREYPVRAVSYTHLDVDKRQTERDLYDWWLHRIADESRVGHRFYGIMTLAIYAKKCGIDEDLSLIHI